MFRSDGETRRDPDSSTRKRSHRWFRHATATIKTTHAASSRARRSLDRATRPGGGRRLRRVDRLAELTRIRCRLCRHSGRYDSGIRSLRFPYVRIRSDSGGRTRSLSWQPARIEFSFGDGSTALLPETRWRLRGDPRRGVRLDGSFDERKFTRHGVLDSSFGVFPRAAGNGHISGPVVQPQHLAVDVGTRCRSARVGGVVEKSCRAIVRCRMAGTCSTRPTDWHRLLPSGEIAQSSSTQSSVKSP